MVVIIIKEEVRWVVGESFLKGYSKLIYYKIMFIWI